MTQSKQQQNKALVIIITAMAATGGLLFGFDTGVISGAKPFFRDFWTLTDKQIEWITTAGLIGAIFGAASSGRITERRIPPILSRTIALPVPPRKGWTISR